MKTLRYVLAAVILAVSGFYADAQVDKKDVRRGNRDFRKENYREADIDYRKALLKDSTSVAANYNLASVLYRQGDMQQAATTLDRIKESAPATESSADYWYNRGDVALGMKDYQTAVDAFAKSLMIRPEDMEAKENFIYAKKMLENQQNQQNQDQNQNDDQNKDQNQDQDQNDDQNKDQNDDQNKDQQNQDQNDDRQNQNKQNQQGQEPKLSPQAAQQMLQAIQAKEKETQEKVKEEKAKALKSRQKEKNW
jgi:tetratricopeptide (TPR) repeat protein